MLSSLSAAMLESSAGVGKAEEESVQPTIALLLRDNIMAITHLPGEILHRISGYLAPTDYEQLRLAHPVFSEPLVSIRAMRSALHDKKCCGTLERHYNRMVEIKRVDEYHRSLCHSERDALRSLCAYAEPQVQDCITLITFYPALAVEQETAVLDIFEQFLCMLEEQAEACSLINPGILPLYSSSYSINLRDTDSAELNHSALYFNHIRSLNQVTGVFIGAQTLFDRLNPQQQLFFAAMMETLRQFWHQHPPVGVSPSTLEKALIPFDGVLRLGQRLRERLVCDGARESDADTHRSQNPA